MRRPLFTSGRPQIVPADAVGVTLLDLRSLNTELQSFTRFVTLYAAGQAASASLVVYFQQGTSTPIQINAATLSSDLSGGPVKVLDRFPLRGDARLFVLAGSLPAVWGYFELDGSFNVEATTRPLQPGPLVSPFTYEPVVVANGDPAADVHLFATGYFDLVVLDVFCSVLEATFAQLTVSDGVATTTLRFAVGTELVRVFDGIPMMALSTNVDPVIALNANTATLALALGSFIRVC
jgi:hypothetical protein